MENNDFESQLLIEKKNKPKINYSFFIQLLTLACTIASISINFYYEVEGTSQKLNKQLFLGLLNLCECKIIGEKC